MRNLLAKKKTVFLILIIVGLISIFLSGKFWPYFRILCSSYYVQNYMFDLEIPQDESIEKFVIANNWYIEPTGHEVDMVQVYSLYKNFNYGPFHPQVHLSFYRPIIEECKGISNICYKKAKTSQEYRELADYTKLGRISIFIRGKYGTLPLPISMYEDVYSSIIEEINTGFSYSFDPDDANPIRSCD